MLLNNIYYSSRKLNRIQNIEKEERSPSFRKVFDERQSRPIAANDPWRIKLQRDINIIILWSCSDFRGKTVNWPVPDDIPWYPLHFSQGCQQQRRLPTAHLAHDHGQFTWQVTRESRDSSTRKQEAAEVHPDLLTFLILTKRNLDVHVREGRRSIGPGEISACYLGKKQQKPNQD